MNGQQQDEVFVHSKLLDWTLRWKPYDKSLLLYLLCVRAQALIAGANQWRVYFCLDRDEATWITQLEALQQGGMMGEEDVVRQGTVLLERTMQLVSLTKSNALQHPKLPILTYTLQATSDCRGVYIYVRKYIDVYNIICSKQSQHIVKLTQFSDVVSCINSN